MLTSLYFSLIAESCGHAALRGDNAEAFAANFKDQPEIRFPKIYREFSNRDVRMAYFKGISHLPPCVS